MTEAYAEVDIAPVIRKMEAAFVDAGVEGVSIGYAEDSLTIETDGIHTCNFVLRDGEVVIDYIESNSMEAGAGASVVAGLKYFAGEYGYTLRASNVSLDVGDFWKQNGFDKDGDGFTYEA